MATGISGFLLGPLGYHTAKTEETVKGAERSSRPLRLPLSLLFLVYDGSYKLCLQAVLHILVHDHIRRTVFVIEYYSNQFVVFIPELPPGRSNRQGSERNALNKRKLPVHGWYPIYYPNRGW